MQVNTAILGKARGFPAGWPEAMRQQDAFLRGKGQLDVKLGGWTEVTENSKQ